MAVRSRNRIDDGGEVRSDNWFAKQLGDAWQTSGDGIYTYVGDEPSEASERGVPNDDRQSDSAPSSGHSLRR